MPSPSISADNDRLLIALRAAVDPVPAATSLPALGQAAGTERRAAVLAILDPSQPGLPVLFIRRSRVVGSHRGQVAFPGGAAEAGDDGVAGTALRETDEELGIPVDAVEVVGVLPPVITATSGRRVDPVIGLLTRPVTPRSGHFEVADWFWVPLTTLLDAPVTARAVPAEIDHRPVLFIDLGDRIIWGATGAMVVELVDRVGRALGREPALRV